VTSAQLIGWAKANMASGKCPRAVRFLNEMPRTSTGKIAKAELKRDL
jgi:acyl-coenzyme A synthetase/AMP-(fatty) acid ligase